LITSTKGKKKKKKPFEKKIEGSFSPLF